MATQRMSFCTFKPKTEFNLNSMVEKLLIANEPQNYCIINEQDENYLSGCYLIEHIQNETKYNMEENKFETVTVSKLSILKFEINLISELLIVWGNKNSAQRLLTALSQAANNNIIIDYCIIDFHTILMRIIDDKSITPSKMKINNIVIEKGIIANCTVNLLNQDDSRELIRKYKDNIVQLSIVFGNSPKYSSEELTSVSATIFSSGSIVIYKDKDDISDDIMSSIQNMIK